MDSVPPEVITPTVSSSPCSMWATIDTTSVSKRRNPGHKPCEDGNNRSNEDDDDIR
jgi:hypothetical protein